ncbi:hypothetical protein O181_117383 [Austropuccinia psidii MF-1]|uniref:Uncharacterized protein n=1 Tax=Austropuccinia psidii MF-1 TaxID=1389203 RepID=A0A9Q3PXF1_9BASI|nr:hypothetical protein [Austropuccinia psidii MF-1]
MNPQNCSYGAGYSDFVKVFSPDELEELLFGYPSYPSRFSGIWEWENNSPPSCPSPPALHSLSGTLSISSYSQEIQDAALAFYAFIESDYNPRLFVPDPFDYFLLQGDSAPSLVKHRKTHPVLKIKPHHYFLRPRDSPGRAITSFKAR